MPGHFQLALDDRYGFQPKNLFIRSAIVLLPLLFAAQSPAQITVSALERKFEAFTALSEIKCIRFADFSEVPEVTVGMTLAVGDLLISEVDDVVMAISYKPGDPGMIFSGRFRVVIAPTSNQEVALNLLSGNVDVQTDTATAISSGETLLGSGRTQYAIRVYRLGEAPVQDVVVYDGEISYRSPEMNQIVGVGQKVRTARSKTTRLLPVESEDIKATAEIYSRACIGKSLLAGESLQDLTAVYSNLTQLYYQVLTSPNDPKVRQELAKKQVSIRVPDHALYQLARAEKYSPETDHFLKAEIYVTKGAAYSQLKMNDRSAELYQKARSYDSEIFDKMDLKSLRVEYDPKREIVPVARDDQKRYLDLLDKGDFKAAIAGFEKRIRSNNANSIDSYGLAYGYMNLKDDKLAAKYASNALTLNEKDGRLLPKQIEFCKKIVDSLKSGKINRYDRR